jgi:hypothetical protein
MLISKKMKRTQFDEIILDSEDLFDLAMQGQDLQQLGSITVDRGIDLEQLATVLEDPSCLLLWTFPESSDISVPEFDLKQQSQWFMPDHYRSMDIAEHVLSLCTTAEQLQRVGQELLMFQEKNLFDLLRFLKYLVDVMRENHVIWGVGRGSSVASYVLYLLGVHKIDSMYYDLDLAEFLR